jgi:hypothetical protein
MLWWWLCGGASGGVVFWALRRLGRWWAPPFGVEGCYGERAVGRLVEAIRDARAGVDVAAAALPDLLADALSAAHARGVGVRVLVGAGVDPGSPALLVLRQAGVAVRSDARSGRVGHVTVVVDGHAVFTGSLAAGELLAVTGSPAVARPHALRLRARFAAASPAVASAAEVRRAA